MKKIDTGGPAFPFAFNEEAHVSDGMTLRDYFASKALPVELGKLFKQFEDSTTEFDTWEDAQAYAARMSYSMADRMMYARKRKIIYRDG